MPTKFDLAELIKARADAHSQSVSDDIVEDYYESLAETNRLESRIKSATIVAKTIKKVGEDVMQHSMDLVDRWNAPASTPAPAPAAPAPAPRRPWTCPQCGKTHAKHHTWCKCGYTQP